MFDYPYPRLAVRAAFLLLLIPLGVCFLLPAPMAAQTSRRQPVDPQADRAAQEAAATVKAKVEKTPGLPEPTEDVSESISNVENFLDDGEIDKAYDLLHLMLTQQQNPPDDAAWLGLGLLLIADRYSARIHDKAGIAADLSRDKPGYARAAALRCYRESVDLFAHIPRKMAVALPAKPAKAGRSRAAGYDYRRLESEALLSEGSFLLEEGYLRDAAVVLEKAHARAEQCGDTSRAASAQIRLGLTEDEIGDNEKASVTLQAALRYFQTRKILTGEAVVLTRLANVRRRRNQFEAAHTLLEEALTKHRTVRYREGEAISLRMLGRVQRQEKRYQEAQAQFDSALAIFRETKDSVNTAITLTDIGENYLLQKQYNEARTPLTEARKITEEADYVPEEGAALMQMGQLERETGHREAARADFTAAQGLFHRLSNTARAAAAQKEASQ